MPGDEIGDMAGAARLGRPGVAAAQSAGIARRIGMKSREQPGDHQLRRITQRRDMRVAVHMLAQKRLQNGGFGAHPAATAPPGVRPAARTSATLAARFRRCAPRVSASRSSVIRPICSRTSSGTSRRRALMPRPARRDRRPALRRERHRCGDVLDAEQPGADAIVEIVIVIGDIIGERRDLRFQPGMAGEIERPGGIGLRHRPGRHDRSGHYAWRGPRASPSSG